VLAAVLVSACRYVAPTAAVAALPPPTGIAVFTRGAQYESVRISPRGTYLAALTVENGLRTLSIIDLRARKLTYVLRPGAAEMVGAYYWANDERVVAEVLEQGVEVAAHQTYGELFAVDASGRGRRMIFGYRATRAERESASVIDTLRGDDRRVLIQAYPWDGRVDSRCNLYKLDVYNGATTLVGRTPFPGASIITDETGRPRIAVGYDAALKVQASYRDPDDGDWQELALLEGVPFAFSSARRKLYVSTRDDAGSSVVAVDIDTGKRQELARNPIASWSSILQDPRTGEIVAVRFDPDLPTYEVTLPDHPLAHVLSGLLAAFPDEHVEIVSATDDLSKVVALVISDRDAGRYFLVDTATLSAEPFLERRPWVKPEKMAEVRGFHIPASDGLQIHGYFALPPGATTPTGLPLVVIPHGGPHARDDWEFNAEVQLFASRGFAVLEVNFRGSTGYGREYQEAAFNHWGDRVQQDIIDATRFMVKQGYVDPQRICTFGASFGGYSAMQSAILAPELFRCAVGYAGVYDLELMGDIDDLSKSRIARGQVRVTVGDDLQALRAASPARHADKLTARVMLVHGGKDKRAPIEHAERLRDALLERGRPVEWVVEPLEGHGFFDELARERMYQKVVDFIEASTKPVFPAP
jgi:dipeptidyl aminopeptidase/acylaminoacyl peptidase